VIYCARKRGVEGREGVLDTGAFIQTLHPINRHARTHAQPPMAEPGQDFFFGGVDNVKWRKVCRYMMFAYIIYIYYIYIYWNITTMYACAFVNIFFGGTDNVNWRKVCV
jgi:hypothetical protein